MIDRTCMCGGGECSDCLAQRVMTLEVTLADMTRNRNRLRDEFEKATKIITASETDISWKGTAEFRQFQLDQLRAIVQSDRGAASERTRIAGWLRKQAVGHSYAGLIDSFADAVEKDLQTPIDANRPQPLDYRLAVDSPPWKVGASEFNNRATVERAEVLEVGSPVFFADVIAQVQSTPARYGDPARTAVANAERVARALNDADARADKRALAAATIASNQLGNSLVDSLKTEAGSETTKEEA